jgi:hypothetical protein
MKPFSRQEVELSAKGKILNDENSKREKKIEE